MSVVYDSGVWALHGDDDDVIAVDETGPVWYLVMRGVREDGSFGAVGVVWLAENRDDGGFVPIARAGWLGSEMRRSYDSARQRGWDAGRIFRYWSEEPGGLSGLEIDPAARAADIAAVRRIAAAA